MPQSALSSLEAHLNQQIMGQSYLVRMLLVALLADGHLLVEGPPGVAKTRLVRTLAQTLTLRFQRIQFTPDLLPADLTGSEIFRPQEGKFEFQPGPLFHQLILADEINRAPAKVQSALLEAMGEGQITVARATYRLPRPFLVMATQNPLEQEGTHPLPEAQLDRFLMKVTVDYPDAATEHAILKLVRDGASAAPVAPLAASVLDDARHAARAVTLAPELEHYLVALVTATRQPPSAIAGSLRSGASSRATLALDRCCRCHALLAQRNHVLPSDILAVAKPILRHRLLLSYPALARGEQVDGVIDALINSIPMP